MVWVIPAALAFVSVAWCPKMFKFIMEPATGQPAPGHDLSTSVSATVELGGVPVNLPPGNTILDVAVNAKSARGKAAIITSFWKLVLIPFVAALFCWLYEIAELKDLSKGFNDFTSSHCAFPHFIAQIFTSFIGYMLGKLACAMCMQRLAFALPIVFATPISVALALIRDQNVVLPFKFGEWNDVLIYVIGFLLLAAQMLSIGYYIFKEQEFIMAKESSLFWMPTYNGRKIYMYGVYIYVVVQFCLLIVHYHTKKQRKLKSNQW